MKIMSNELGSEEQSVYGVRGVRGWLKKMLPEDAYGTLRGLRVRLVDSVWGHQAALASASYLGAVSHSPTLSALHYAFISREFDREHRAVLAARAQHVRDLYAGRGNIYMLRRNVHRLEKGLIMVPPRPVFGLSSIGPTVQSYAACMRSMLAGAVDYKTSLEWSRGVLDMYFERVEHPVADKARAQYDAVNREAREHAERTVGRQPFVRPEADDLPSVEQLENLARYRRSVRWFDGRTVPRTVVDRAMRIAMESPSACNRQPFRYEVFDRHDLVQKVGAVPKGTPGWLHQIPCFIVIIGQFDAFRFERDRHVPYIDGCLSAMALIYGLEVQGVSSCCVNFPDFPETEARMAEVLQLEPWERAIMCLAVGYPEQDHPVPHSQKLPLEMARSFNGERSGSRGGSELR